MQVEGHQEESLLSLLATGARVSNTYPTCPLLGDSLSKERLISDSIYFPHGFYIKEIRYEMGMRSISLLGGVTAHQDYDG